MNGRVMLVDDDPAVREALCQSLELADYAPLTAASFVEAKDHISADFPGVIVSDIRMPGRDGFHLLEYALEQDADLPVILLTGEGDIPMAVRAMGQGAFAFLEKPCAPGDLIASIEKAMRTRALVLENRQLKVQLETGDPAARMIFGASDLAEELRDRVRMAARSGADVLVTGAAGTGVSKVAEVVHLCSPRAKATFEKRASDALDRNGLTELWHSCVGGTVFLDQIERLTKDGQIALLDLMDRGDVVLIGGTTIDLEDVTASGGFSTDLYYRLKAVSVRIPSLAERPGDIPVLFRSYVAQAAEQAGLPAREVSPDVIAGLMAREWPGNARALMSEAMRFVLGLDDAEGSRTDLGLVERMAQVERSILVEALSKSKGNASEAAQTLKLPRKTFYDKLAKYQIRPETFRH